MKAKYPDVSHADLFQMASAAAIEAAGGPKIDMQYGRKDVTDEQGGSRLCSRWPAPRWVKAGSDARPSCFGVMVARASHSRLHLLEGFLIPVVGPVAIHLSTMEMWEKWRSSLNSV
eukprot:1154561-Pelagomonas_calceolata.AAC.5